MSNFYVKVPPHIAKEMGLTDKPTLKLPDGNYSAFITHFHRYCPIYEIRDMVPRMGALILTPGQLKEERLGIVNRPLPEPTDPIFAAPAEEPTPSGEPILTEEPAPIEEVVGETNPEEPVEETREEPVEETQEEPEDEPKDDTQETEEGGQE